MVLSGCVEALFAREYAAVEDRIKACARAGIGGIEFWQWSNKNIPAIERALGETGLPLVFMSNEPRAPIVDRATHRDFITGLRETIRVAKRLKASQLGILVDDRGVGDASTLPRQMPRAEQHDAIVAALKEAAPIVEDGGLRLLIEPLNSKSDHRGHYLDSTVEGLDIVAEVASPNVLLLFDIYHSAMMGEDAETVIGDRGRLIGHVHAADMPGRAEPGSGTIDWRRCLRLLGQIGYRGPIGLEYWPSTATDVSIRTAQSNLL